VLDAEPTKPYWMRPGRSGRSIRRPRRASPVARSTATRRPPSPSGIGI